MLHTQPPEVASPHGPLPPALVALVRRCMEKNPDGRPSTVREVRGVLAAIAAGRRGGP